MNNPIITPQFVTRHLKELIANEIKVDINQPEGSTPDSILVDDVPEAKVEKPVSKMKERFVKAEQERQSHEDRLHVSKTQIELVNKETKRLASEVNDFIKKLRTAAQQTADNPRLMSRLETLRRMSNLPSYATAMFVEEKQNGS
jgi:hypothetical protein